jgi:hypothetical protein
MTPLAGGGGNESGSRLGCGGIDEESMFGKHLAGLLGPHERDELPGQSA